MYIYICCRLQKRGPIFRFIGAETGPKLEVEMDNGNNEKTISSLVLGSHFMYPELHFCIWRARIVRGFNNGAFMLRNIPAPVLNPCPAPFSNAPFPAPKVPFRWTSQSAQTPIFEAPKAFRRGSTGTAHKPPCIFRSTSASTRKPKNVKTQGRFTGPASW